jgi:hypothetical protein
MRRAGGRRIASCPWESSAFLFCCRLRVFYVQEQPLLGLAIGEMDQRAGFILGHVRQAGLHDGRVLSGNGERGALTFLVDHALHRFGLTC